MVRRAAGREEGREFPNPDRNSFSAETGIPYYLAHPGHFGFHRGGKLLRRTADGLHAGVGKLFLHVGPVEEAHDFFVQFVDDSPRRFRRREYAVDRYRFITW